VAAFVRESPSGVVELRVYDVGARLVVLRSGALGVLDGHSRCFFASPGPGRCVALLCREGGVVQSFALGERPRMAIVSALREVGSPRGGIPMHSFMHGTRIPQPSVSSAGRQAVSYKPVCESVVVQCFSAGDSDPLPL